jgi:hypothetical protein
MTVEEKRAWVTIVTTVVAYAVYAVVVGRRLLDSSADDVRYQWAMVWAVGLSIASQIVFHVVASTFSDADARQKDARDHEIHRFAEFNGMGFLVIGAVAALLLALTEQSSFWIANALYLGFSLSAITSSVAKIAAYRGGLPTW